MEHKKPIFHSGSRKPFPEEQPVMDVVRRAKDDVAQRHGGRVVQGTVLFKSFSTTSATATVHPRAVDIVNAAVGNAVASGATARIISGPPAENAATPRRSGIAQAQGEVAASLRRLGIRR